MKLRIVTDSTFKEDSEWNNLVLKVLGENINPRRSAGFCKARQALRDLLNDEGYNPAISELIFTNYHELNSFPQYTVSLSHSTVAGAALIGKVSVYRALGCDIELKDRQVKESILKRISHPEDIKLKDLELWCLKEAVFKTVMNTHWSDKPVEFSSLIIRDQSWSFPQADMEGQWLLRTFEQHVVAQAWLPA